MPETEIPAPAGTAALLYQLYTHGFHVPPALAGRAVKAVMTSRFSLARELRRHLAVIQGVPTNLEDLFTSVFTPQYFISMFEDLCLEGRLSRRDASRMQDALLWAVDRNGQWHHKKGETL